MAESKVCMSCLGTEIVFDIFDTHECEGNEEIYAEMLKFCFDISIPQESASKYLCESCILKLREAFFFKQDVLRNIQVFKLEDSKEFVEETASLYISKDNRDGNRRIYVLDLDNTTTMNSTEYCLKTNPSSAEEKNSNNSQALIEDNKFNISKNTVWEKSKVKVEKGHNLDDSSRGEAEFKCELCPKIFTSRVAIQRHSKTHLEGPFTCNVCEQVFAKLNSRNAHIWRVHNTTEPYVCSRCGDRFTTFHKRLVHLQEAHNIKPQYKCNYCEKIFTDTSSRWQHERNLHLRVRNHKCTHCGMAFYKRREMNSHLSAVHGVGEKLFACDVCDKRFYLLRSLKVHLKTHENRSKRLRCNANNSTEHVQDPLEVYPQYEEIVKQELIGESMDGTVIVEDHILEGSNDTIYFEIGEIMK